MLYARFVSNQLIQYRAYFLSVQRGFGSLSVWQATSSSHAHPVSQISTVNAINFTVIDDTVYGDDEYCDDDEDNDDDDNKY